MIIVASAMITRTIPLMSLVLNICLISSLIIEQICDSYVFVCKYHSITGEFTPDLWPQMTLHR